jgi:hypothetical protein
MGNQQTVLTKRSIDTPSGRISYAERASISSASKMKPGALAPGTRNLPSSKRSTAGQAKGAVMA